MEAWYRAEYIINTNVFLFLKQKRSDYETSHPCRCSVSNIEFPPPCLIGSNRAEPGIHDNSNDQEEARSDTLCECPCFSRLTTDTCLQEDPRFYLKLPQSSSTLKVGFKSSFVVVVVFRQGLKFCTAVTTHTFLKSSNVQRFLGIFRSRRHHQCYGKYDRCGTSTNRG